MNGGAAAAEAPLPHGGRLAEARVRFPAAAAPFLDLSTGINPHAYPVATLSEAVFTRLPEPQDHAALEAGAAVAYGVTDPAMVVAAPGTQLLIGLLPRLLAQARIAVLGPTYSEHAASWRAAGAEVIETTDLDTLAAAPAAVLCNPNNPDGRRFAAPTLLALADTLAGRGGVLVVDEAFADLEEPALSLAPHLPHPAAVVLRSFGKTYGLAGLRLGFALAAPARAAVIRAALGPWAVCGPALAIGRVALADSAWRAAMRTQLAEETARLDALLATAGLPVIGGTRLFRLTESPHAGAVFARLGRAGILVRDFPEQRRWLRFGLPGTPQAWGRLRAALAGQ
jgi:cobalamin biosynthetic protein CobC